jgi:hypothetical protein
MNTSIEFFLLSLIFSKPKPSPSRTPTIAAGRDLPELRRGHHQHRRPRLALPARGIEPGRAVASPSTSSSPTPASANSGEPGLPLPRRQALRAPGELLILIACTFCSIAS